MVTNSKWIIARKNSSDEDKPKKQKVFICHFKIVKQFIHFNVQIHRTSQQEALSVGLVINRLMIEYKLSIISAINSNDNQLAHVSPMTRLYHSFVSERRA